MADVTTALHLLLPGPPPAAAEVQRRLRAALDQECLIERTPQGSWYIRSVTASPPWMIRAVHTNVLLEHPMDLPDCSPLEKAKLQAAEWTLMVEGVLPNTDTIQAFGLFMQIAYAAVPDALAVIDLQADAIRLNGWLRDVASPGIPFPISAMYRIHAVTDGEQVWMHTHGLQRAGLPEIEVLAGNEDQARNLRALLRTVVNRALVHKLPSMGETIAYGQQLECALVPWRYVHTNIRPTIGGLSDRDVDHPEDSLTLVTWQPTSETTGEWQSIAKTTPLLTGNPVFFLTDYETERLEALARLRWRTFAYLADQYAQTQRWSFLAKFSYGGDVPGTSREHLWFEVHAADLEGADATLLNVPFQDTLQLSEGQRGYHNIERLTDFRVNGPYGTAAPDSIDRLLARMRLLPRSAMG